MIDGVPRKREEKKIKNYQSRNTKREQERGETIRGIHQSLCGTVQQSMTCGHTGRDRLNGIRTKHSTQKDLLVDHIKHDFVLTVKTEPLKTVQILE